MAGAVLSAPQVASPLPPDESSSCPVIFHRSAERGVDPRSVTPRGNNS